MKIADDIEDEMQRVPVIEKSEEASLTVEEQNEIMGQALLDIFNIYMTFDYPKAEDFGMIAQRTLKKVGRI